jgi:hypothetical protein
MGPATVVDTRTAFTGAVTVFLETAGRITDDQWGRPATEEWSVRELFAHTVRAMAVTSRYLDVDPPSDEPLLGGAAAYYRAALAVDGVHAGIIGRAKAGAAELGDDPVDRARAVAEETLAWVAGTADDALVSPFTHPMGILDYLETRVLELVVHTFDLQVACGLPLAGDPGALAVTNGVLLDLADRADPVALALALTGRGGPRRCNVLG